MSRQDFQTDHEKRWQGVHPTIRAFFQSLYGYTDTQVRQNYIGAMAQAFSLRMLPALLTKGPGEVVKQQLIQTAPQVYVTHTPVPTGIAGIAAGQIWNGQLIDNSDAPIV